MNKALTWCYTVSGLRRSWVTRLVSLATISETPAPCETDTTAQTHRQPDRLTDRQTICTGQPGEKATQTNQQLNALNKMRPEM